MENDEIQIPGLQVHGFPNAPKLCFGSDSDSMDSSEFSSDGSGKIHVLLLNLFVVLAAKNF